MSDTGMIGIAIIILNVFVSYKGFKDPAFFEAYKFEVDKILLNKDYKRLVTSGFLHLGWMHLIFNMFSLYAFSGSIEAYFGGTQYLVIYLAGLLGGNLLALLIHKNDGDYSAAGASGAVCGIIFASIALFPVMSVGIFPLPLSIPGWLYGLLYVGYSIYGIRSKTGNIGHEAHLGGALVGMMVAIGMEPRALVENCVTILVIVIPTLAFIIIIQKRPQLFLVDNYFFKTHLKGYNIDQRYNIQKRVLQREIDQILDKIHQKGMSSLTKKEKQKLEEFARKK